LNCPIRISNGKELQRLKRAAGHSAARGYYTMGTLKTDLKGSMTKWPTLHLVNVVGVNRRGVCVLLLVELPLHASACDRVQASALNGAKSCMREESLIRRQAVAN
jgi:hypothetical protein